jgi:hypothetical protein
MHVSASRRGCAWGSREFFFRDHTTALRKRRDAGDAMTLVHIISLTYRMNG